MVNAQYEAPVALLNENKQYQTHCDFDEADSLLLGLEKSMKTDKHLAAPEAVGSSMYYNLDGCISKAGDIFESYPMAPPMAPPSTKDTSVSSHDLSLFMDQVMRPTLPTLPQPRPFDLNLSIELEPHPQNDKKRFLEEPTFLNTEPPASKRSRICNVVEDDESSQEEESLPKFRNYQEQQWQEQYQGLLEFKAKHGHCCVPNSYPPNPVLGRWVKRQRYQYKLRESGKQSTLVAPRVQALEAAGFVWDSHSALWEERLNELKQYRIAHGDCNVPSSYPKSKQLSTWVKCQRRQYRLFGKGKNSNLTEERIAALDDLGFVWDGRTIGNRCSKAAACESTRPRSTRFLNANV
ncbi:unnamed protein product [Cylindrotheca closterium]|uniref:Helicase-associated domain-containing protein n=1 Tax=Cylindrotheca closterium TaxID=2856 RepID=A0AAD2FD99_9STRA|nr:unnamed protein product [Cylindrotheca closterium]